MPDHAVATRYADALFEVAERQGSLEAVDRDLADVAQLLREEPELARAWDNPVVPTSDKKRIAEQLLTGKIDRTVLHTLLLMLDNQRGACFPALQRAFRDRYDRHRRRVKVHVLTAFPLDEHQAGELRTTLARATERDVEMDAAVDPALIGGVVVTVGDQVLDDSLRGRLEGLTKVLA